MGKRNLLSPPRSGVTINMTKRQARKLLRVLDQESVDDLDLAAVFYALKELLKN